MTPLEISLKILPALIAILSFLLVIYVGKTYHPMAALHRTYIRIDGILHEKKVFFDYEETRRFLMSHGAAFRIVDRSGEIPGYSYLSGGHRIHGWNICKCLFGTCWHGDWVLFAAIIIVVYEQQR